MNFFLQIFNMMVYSEFKLNNSVNFNQFIHELIVISYSSHTNLFISYLFIFFCKPISGQSRQQTIASQAGIKSNKFMLLQKSLRGQTYGNQKFLVFPHRRWIGNISSRLMLVNIICFEYQSRGPRSLILPTYNTRQVQQIFNVLLFSFLQLFQNKTIGRRKVDHKQAKKYVC